jgi:aminopeptidase
MKDFRVKKLAQLLTEYSVELKPRAVVSIYGQPDCQAINPSLLPRGVAPRRIRRRRTWRRISKKQQALTDFPNKSREVPIVAEDTDLRYSCRGRRWINCDGHENFPDGEVFTGLVEDSVEDHIKFNFPAVRGGRDVDGVRLTFERGKVARAEAEKGQDFLRAMIGMDKRSCYLGEAAIGVNYNVKRYTKNTLFDEKIGGTIHLALGAGYPETGNKNRSGLQ